MNIEDGVAMKISVIGIDVMGEPIARNLQIVGMAVTVYCRTPTTRRAFEGSGIVKALRDKAAP
ncbi:NAD(P)-binding domain-containing protein [Achromobacter sp.]|uniref:NAD(P)-binding domain-containing protein n=1 Tax=Achromobacter sp. TaxID=134375 RepID=UPI003C710F1C